MDIAGAVPAKHTKQKQKPSDKAEQFMLQGIKRKRGDNMATTSAGVSELYTGRRKPMKHKKKKKGSRRGGKGSRRG